MWIFDALAEPMRRGVLLAVTVAVSLASCDGCGEDPLAELTSHEGAVERDHAESVERWVTADDGATFVVGDGIRTLDDATARLSLGVSGALELDPRTLVRFRLLDDDEGRRSIEVVSGEATIESGEEEVSVETAVGPAVLEPGGRLRVAGGGQGRLSVLVGRAVLERDGEEVVVAEGETLEVTIGMAELEPEPATEEPATEEPATEEPAAEEPAAGGVALAVQGSARWQPPGAEALAPLAAGEHLAAPGTRLALSPDARVGVTRGDERVELAGRGEFVVGEEGRPILRAVSGASSLDARRAQVALEVPGGVIIATLDGGGTRARVEVDEDSARVEVDEGRVQIREGGESRFVDAGDEGRVARRRASAGRDPIPALGPATAHVAVGSSGGATIHSPRPPIVVGIPVSGCEGDAVVRTGRSGARGSGGRVNVSLPRGNHRYTLHCVEDGAVGPEIADGRVRVLRDSGRARVPRTPPTSVVDADGRPYTVVYQNLLPRVVVRWTGGERGPYTLELRRAGGRAITRRSAQPRFQLPSGAVPEGTHTLTVRDGAGHTSAATRLTVRFDNAAPTASIRSPRDRSFGVGDTVTVSGVAQSGWSVDVDGAPVQLDAQYRFESPVTVASSGVIAIRLTHAQRGVHYYLRRAR